MSSGGVADALASFPDRLSPAALGRYRSCPQSFYLSDVERLPRDEQPSPVLCQANAVHHALERFFGLPLLDRQPENLERALRSVWPSHRRPGAFLTREQERAYGLEALEMLSRFGESFDLTALPLAREQWVTTRVKGVELFGKVDRIDPVRRRGDGDVLDGGMAGKRDLDAGGERHRDTGGMPEPLRRTHLLSNALALELVDYKTGRNEIEPEDLPHEPAAQIYLLAAEATYRKPVERVRFIYLRGGRDVSWYPEREDVEAIGEGVVELVEAMRGDIEFEARPGPQCRWCPVALRCPDRQAVSLSDLVAVEEMAF